MIYFDYIFGLLWVMFNHLHNLLSNNYKNNPMIFNRPKMNFATGMLQQRSNAQKLFPILLSVCE